MTKDKVLHVGDCVSINGREAIVERVVPMEKKYRVITSTVFRTSSGLTNVFDVHLSEDGTHWICKPF